jgi:hypothetical protein
MFFTHLLGLQKLSCSECNGEEFDKEEIPPNKRYIYSFLHKLPRSPPETKYPNTTLTPFFVSNVNVSMAPAMATV